MPPSHKIRLLLLAILDLIAILGIGHYKVQADQGDMSHTCNYKCEMPNGDHYVCPRPRFDNEHCFLHSRLSDKSVERFHTELSEIFANKETKEYNCRGICFPSRFRANLADLVFDKPVHFGILVFDSDNGVIFRGAHFLDEFHFNCEGSGIFNCENAKFDSKVIIAGVKKINFRKATCQGEVEFKDCVFEQSALANSRFRNNVKFSDCNFTGNPALNDTEFLSEVDFISAAFNSGFIFKSAKFNGPVHFNDIVAKKSGAEFKNCVMKGVKLSQFDFEDVGVKLKLLDCKWPRRRYIWFEGRQIIGDEIWNVPCETTINIYRNLHRHYYNRSEFELAHDFYVGFMIAKRKVIKKGFWAKGIDWLYSLLSRYGTSINRPLISLFVMWFALPGLLLTLDFPKQGDAINYWQAFYLNLSLSTINRGYSTQLNGLLTWPSFIIFVETLLNVLLVAFLALGIRRHFAPKKPIEKAE